MKINAAEFLVSAVSPQQYPRQPFPEVAFAGRSNVGKSSLINTLVHRKSLVKTSATPGKTRTINFFLINHCLMFVDLPGYGYAKVPLDLRASWRPMVEAYLKRRDRLQAVVHIVDLRHPPTEQDQQLRAWLLHQGVTVITVATKADKIKRSQHAVHSAIIRDGLGLTATEPLVLFSSHTHNGRLTLWGTLNALLAPRQPAQGSAADTTSA